MHQDSSMKFSSVAGTFSLKTFCLISAVIVEAAWRRLSGIRRCLLERKATQTPALLASDSWGNREKMARRLLMVDKGAKCFYISHTHSKIWKPGRPVAVMVGGAALLSITQTAASNQPSAPQKLPSHLMASASVQRVSCFQGAPSSCLQHLDPRSPSPDSVNAFANVWPVI